MSEARTRRAPRRQMGQFFTPPALARRLVGDLRLLPHTRVLEPSVGDGAFVMPLVERFMALHSGSPAERLARTLAENLWTVELDPIHHASLIERLARTFGPLPTDHHLVRGDFFRHDPSGPFDLVIGNPPFGGTIEAAIQDDLERRYGWRDGLKIKKETYSLFIVRCVELLAPGGRLRFICSDTFLTIPTMKGLREFLLNRGTPRVTRLPGFSGETQQPMVILDFERGTPADAVQVNGNRLPRPIIDQTGNRSWQVDTHHAPLFAGPKLGDLVTATSGMTIGRNDLFLREMRGDEILEPLSFEFYEEPITIARERERARLGHLGPRQEARIRDFEAAGASRRNVRVLPLPAPLAIRLPHPDYRPYNKACADIVYAPPRHVVFWRDDGDAVLTFKRNGNWYLHGVGGLPYFGREGLTWQLIAPTLNVRHLPAGHILDSGAPCAFPKEGTDPDELWFILGWTLTRLASRIQKEVLNHTRNIQSKDFERLPYPWWVPPQRKEAAIRRVRDLVAEGLAGRRFQRGDPEIVALEDPYRPPDP